ncbi:hypothetical protein DdX_17530 [Ditylenchus destructor]|uniref:Uncharacterized protein n=1 Tax=Ditylenchus destructor TaxID=166010 RepID=A0AAD4QYX9_9BILA|nr:hypothetical protein DdX_17530 [Ditylenchus destructor]
MYTSVVIGFLVAAFVNARPQGPPPFVDGVPPGFSEVLPSDVVQQLKDVHSNQDLSMPEKKEAFDKIMDTVEPATLAKLPSPPFLSQLPEDVQEKIKEIQSNTEMKWSERVSKFMQIMESLPANLKRLFGPPPPPPSSGGGAGSDSSK